MSELRYITISLDAPRSFCGMCVHCNEFTQFKIWRWNVNTGKGEFVFDCGCKFAQMKERIGL